MTIGASIFLIAVGAILRYATDFSVQSVDMDTVGLILMIAGAAGLVLGFAQQFAMSKQQRDASAYADEERRRAIAEEERRRAAAEQQRREPPAY